MNKENILKVIKKLRESSDKRKFKQGFDVVVNLKQIDLKKPDHKVESFLVLPHGNGKKLKVCAFVDKELINGAKAVFDRVVAKDDFPRVSKKELKNIAREFDFFVAQASCMVDIAKVFGKVFGPRNKMPNPKMGCVVPPTASLAQVKERLNKTIRLQNKKELIVKASIGKESMSDEQILQNITTTFDTILRGLPHDKQNIGSIYLKLTMSAPVQVGGKQ